MCPTVTAAPLTFRDLASDSPGVAAAVTPAPPFNDEQRRTETKACNAVRERVERDRQGEVSLCLFAAARVADALRAIGRAIALTCDASGADMRAGARRQGGRNFEAGRRVFDILGGYQETHAEM